MLDEGLYGLAFRLLRRQRVDLNLLVDHNPRRFLGEVDTFLDQVTATEDLNLFISALNEDNVEAKRYPPPPWYPPRPQGEDEDLLQGGKQNRVCELIRAGLVKKRGASAALQPILSTYAKQDPPRYEEALQLICHECRGVKGEKLSGEMGQKLIKYLAFFTKIDPLYDSALGMYDYDLVRAVARQSQKDPREYLPYLERLQSLPPWRARWEIDLQLGRHVKALGHVAEQQEEEDVPGDVMDEFMRVVEAQELQEEALGLFKDKKPRFPVLYQRLLSSHAARLMKLGEPRKAMLAYLSQTPPDLLQAAHAARAAGMWRQSLNLVSQHDPSGPTMKLWAEQVAKDLCDVAADKEMLRDAGVVKIEYLDDVEGGVMSLCEAGAWVEATSTCCRYGRRDLLVTDVYAAVRDCQEVMVDEVKGRRKAFEKNYDKWLVVKEKAKEEEQLEEEELQGMDGDDHETRSQYSGVTGASEGSLISRASTSQSSAISVATSLLSYRSNHPGMTTTMNGDDGSKSSFKVEWGSSNRWGKTKRKRGRPRGVKVSARKEALSLLKDLKGMAPSTTLLQEAASLSEALVVQGDEDKAQVLDEAVQSLVDYCHARPLPEEESGEGGDKASTIGGGSSTAGVPNR